MSNGSVWSPLMDTPSTRRPVLELRDRLRIARDRADIGVARMAEIFRISRTTVSNWEAGRTIPRSIEIEKWADVTGVDLEWLDPDHDVRSRCSDTAAGSEAAS